MCVLMPILPEDELENVALAEHEKTKKQNELKIKRRDYTGYDDDEFAPGHAGMKRSVLSKYDEFLEGEKETVSWLRIDVDTYLTSFEGVSSRRFYTICAGSARGTRSRRRDSQQVTTVY